MGLSLMLIPMVSRNVDQMSPAQQRTQALRLSIPLFALAIVYAAAVYFGGAYALRALFGEHVEDAVAIVKIMAFVPLFLAAPMPASVFLSALQRANMRFYSQTTAAIGTMLVGVPLVVLYDVRGAAVALLFSQVLFSVGQWSCLFWVWRRRASLQAA
jgi:O-antigen/teichoic acid export membrane protein